jgi:RNA polymerase sigma-70 factor (ECF subfamily)
VVPVEELRPLSFAVAYRMLGSVAEAEDVVQEALLRLHDAQDDVDNPEAWLTTTTTRLAIDVLRSARVRRERYVGDWLPEPLVDDAGTTQIEDEETISLAFLVLLERLTPEERAVLVLRDAFDYSFAEIADIVGKSEANTRQILSRARRHVDEERPRFDPDPEQRFELAERFLQAARDGDMDGLLEMLAPDAVLTGDGGGKAIAIGRQLVGAEPIAHALRAFAVRGFEYWKVRLEPALVNGQPGFRTFDEDGRLVNVVSVDIVDGRVVRVYSILNPDKLGHLADEISTAGLKPQFRGD